MAKKTTIIPVGPYHPLQEEPEFFKLYVEGEKVVGLDIELGYNHRGVEKLSEGKDYEETIFLVERVCGICSTSHPIACVQAIEEAGDLEVPQRALYIRSLIGELERIHSHLLWLGLAGHFLGFNTVWMWAWRYREEVLNICEQVTGNRNHYGMLKPGGVRRDVPATEISAIRKMLDTLSSPLDLFRDTVAEDPLIQARTRGIGTLTPQQIRKFAAVGPTARASGVDIDVRRDHPHAAYGMVEWDVVLESRGDIFDKIMVRIGEMFQSVRIIRQCLSRLETEPGPIDSHPKEVKPGEGIGHYEAPRGEVFHYIRSDGSNRPVRHKIRAPSYMNVPTNREAVIGETIADATIILAAVDPCYCCTERMAAVLDPETDRVLISGKELLQRSRRKTAWLRSQLGHEGPDLKWDC
ncbi:MAG: NADH:ubiquinone oxidoreductase [Planctomycetales bacterium]|nr:NADH:ubiquinone oxidoreductase [Planctomycetales bacterium]NIM08231.1 NADH:ubiquinone oxidoreductase [Planctomycetales bacterium]NIN07725.1 NADH:ubiquinone oxidoreductase [Planctomycetales bacterium]NIN76851.1 NADH:ubiquinone oxidoreductase [Planctomycetales bacterium]NIO34047.1 NADH:ubiquinone oxidoreductase [Planctomycetales bacterium]